MHEHHTYFPVGVVVGRFQVAKLHEGHVHVLEYVSSLHEDVMVVLGVSQTLATNRNPLSFDMRKHMIEAKLPNAIVLPLKDHRSDAEWSKDLDALIESAFPGRGAILYGSRDSFLGCYSGKNRTEHVSIKVSPSGTDLRQGASILATTDFNAGVIHSNVNRPGIPYPTIDIAIVREDRGEVLLAGKNSDGGKLRFIGGFVDPTDQSLEAAAKREAFEETSGMEIADIRYVGSAKVDDWRYRGTADGIMTTLFKATYVFGPRKPGDDIDRLEWVPFEKLEEVLVPEHLPLSAMLMPTLAPTHTA